MQNSMNSAKVAAVASTHTPSTQILQDLLTHYRSLAATSSSSTEEHGRPDHNGLGGTVQDMLIGKHLYLCCITLSNKFILLLFTAFMAVSMRVFDRASKDFAIWCVASNIFSLLPCYF